MKQKTKLFAPALGRMQCKFNRIRKIYADWKNLEKKLDVFMQVQSSSERSQCALAVKMMFYTGIRIGNEDSAEGYTTKPHPKSKVKPVFTQTYGLTTLPTKCIQYNARAVVMSFTGKKSVAQQIKVQDPVLVKQIKQQLKYSNGTFLSITDYELRKFVKRSIGRGFIPKDFRTLRANIEAWNAHLDLMQTDPPETKSELKAEIKAICERVSKVLGNTPGATKKSYIDDRLLEYHSQQRY